MEDMAEEGDVTSFWKDPEVKEATKKGFRIRLIFDFLLFSFLVLIAITIYR